MSIWRSLALLAFVVVSSVGCAASDAGYPRALEVRAIDSPAGPGAMGSSLVTSADGATWLSWLEPMPADRHVLKCARFDSAAMRWEPPCVIAEGAGWIANWADFPVLAVQLGRMTAAWSVGSNGHGAHGESYRALFSTSTDYGATWSEPQPVSRESTSVEFVALQPLADGRVVAAWLDGRARLAGEDRQTLYARVLTEAGPEMLVDEQVCDCCQLSLSATPGGAILAYRGRTHDEVRDIRWTRFHAGRWTVPQPVHSDGWRIAGCPVNGPQLAAVGEHVAAAWFTAADGTPQVWAARLEGEGFSGAQRIDLGHPIGRVDCVVFSDGTTWISWLEGTGSTQPGGIYLREISPRGETSTLVRIADATSARSGGFPRMALLAGDGSPRALIGFTQAGSPSSVVVAMVTAR